MKLAALHAGSDDDGALAPLWAAVAKASPDRVVVLGAAARWAARRAGEEEAEAERRFVDETAAYLVEDRDGPPPKRAEPGLLARAARVAADARAVELFGPFVCILQDAPVRDDELESAHVWIVPADKSGVARREGRVVVELGDPACAVVEGADPVVTLIGPDGAVAERVPLALSTTNKMTVQGSAR